MIQRSRALAALALPLVISLVSACGSAPLDGMDVGAEDEGALTQSYAPGTILRATTNVWLRATPSTSGTKIDLVSKGQQVTVVSSTTSNGYIKVKFGTETGWSYGTYYEKVSDPDGGSSDGSGDGGGATLATITSLAGSSACYAYQWKNRGQMPKGYVKGVALVYARAVCELTRTDVAVVKEANTGNDKIDALSWFNSNFNAVSMPNNVAGVDTLRHAYTLLIGLGMRESSGEHCVGRDTSASNWTSSSAEAGAWQTSYDSHTSSVELDKLFTKYRNDSSGCLLSTFAEGVTCSSADWQDWGSGDGYTYQKLNKECPAFAAEYAAVMLRVNGGSAGHYGPLRTKAAEIRPECDAMLRDVQTVVEQNPGVCASL